MAFYDPKKKDNFFLYNWVHLGANLKSVARAPVSFSEKLRIYGFEGRRTIWDRKLFFHELTRITGLARRKL
jgi:hypothetical protein